LTRLNQIVALEKQVKADVRTPIDGVYHAFQKPDLFAGLVKTYESLEEDGFIYPSESKKVVARVPELITQIQGAWTRLMDLVLTKDAANTEAVADIYIDGVALVNSVPVTTLLWLEKQLVDLRTIVSKIPVLDVTEDWNRDEANSLYRTEPVRTLRSKKVTEFLTVAPATDKHPAQVREVVKDVPEGHWSTTKLSGAVSAKYRQEMTERVIKLQEAVKKARETANMTEVSDRSMGAALLGYVFGS
jgi:hypothetical protein